MERVVLFTVGGRPVPKGRPRVTRHGTYTPKSTQIFEGEIRAARHPGCHSECPHYATDIAARSAAKEEKRRLTDAKCDWLCARQFKTQRMQNLKK